MILFFVGGSSYIYTIHARSECTVVIYDRVFEIYEHYFIHTKVASKSRYAVIIHSGSLVLNSAFSRNVLTMRGQRQNSTPRKTCFDHLQRTRPAKPNRDIAIRLQDQLLAYPRLQKDGAPLPPHVCTCVQYLASARAGRSLLTPSCFRDDKVDWARLGEKWGPWGLSILLRHLAVFTLRYKDSLQYSTFKSSCTELQELQLSFFSLLIRPHSSYHNILPVRELCLFEYKHFIGSVMIRSWLLLVKMSFLLSGP